MTLSGAGNQEQERQKVHSNFYLSLFKKVNFKMASNLPYLKGVRTCYVNTLKRETDNAKNILACDTKLVDETELILSINRKVERLQLNCDKVENQTDKLAEALGVKDEELTKH